MKISNYILAAFLTFVFGVFLSMFIDAKLHGGNSKNKKITYIKEEKLADFSVLVAEDESDIIITNGIVNEIKSEISSRTKPKNQRSPYNFCRISNDTLFVKKADSINYLVIKVKSLSKIIGKKNSKINLSGFHNDTLSFELDKTVLEGTLSNAVINFIEIEAKNHSNINLRKMYTRLPDTINGKPKYKDFYRVLKQSKITLKNHSKLTMHHIRELVIDADSTSHYKILK